MSYLPLSPAGRRYGRFRDNPFSPARKLRAIHTNHAIVLPATAMALCAYKGPTRDQGNEGSCHDDQTEVLTDRGFRFFADLNGTEKLGTVNPETSELFFEIPTRLIRFNYSGPLHCAKNRFLNFRVTPDHKMLVRKWNENERTLDRKYQFIPAQKIGWYAGLMNRVKWSGAASTKDTTSFKLPGVGTRNLKQKNDTEAPLKAWLRFLGIYIAEGTMINRSIHRKRRNGKDEITYKVQIAASKEREKEFARKVFSDLGIHALEVSDRFTFSNRRIYEAMSSLGLEGVKAGEKFVPEFIFHLNADLISEFLSGHFAGDGGGKEDHRSHYTSSSRLASDLQTLIFLSGNQSGLYVRQPRTSVMKDGRVVKGKLPEHRVSVCERKTLSIEAKNTIFVEDYDGEVFCAEVPTYHTLVTRREGKILISGNCCGQAGAEKDDLDYRQFSAGWPDRSIPAATFQASAEFIYLCNLIADGDIGTDAGSTLHQTAITLSQKGACQNAAMPYSDSQFSTPPNASQYTSGLLYRMDAYHFLPDLPSMKACLAPSAAGPGHSFIFGINVYDSFEGTWAQPGFMPMPNLANESLQGGHAQHAIGYDDTVVFPDGSKGGLFVQNSWGDQSVWPQGINAPGATDGGCYWMPYAFVTSSDPTNGPFVSDAWISHNGIPWK